VLRGVGLDVSTFLGVGSGALKRGAGPESESEKCDSAYLWLEGEGSKQSDFFLKLLLQV